MRLSTATFTAALAAGSVHASPGPLSRRQGGWWDRDACVATVDGNVIGGRTIQMLRNTWSNHFAGDLGGSLKSSEVKGVCCWGQCLWVLCIGDHRDWNGDQFVETVGRLTELVGEQEKGVCGARVADDPYLILMTGQHDGISHAGEDIGVVLGDTCKGNPPW